MKRLLIVLVGLFVFGSAFAWDDGRDEPEFSEVQSYDFDLSVESEDGQVEIEWEEFEWDDFKWYKFVYSKTDKTPVYPEDKSQYFGDDAERDEAKIWLDAGSYYVRLCAITHDNDRYCSAVKRLVVEKKEYYKEEKDYDDKDEYEKKQAVKKAILKKAATKKAVKKGALSDTMKTRVDTALERFIERLEGKGYSNEKMVETLDKVIDRLEWFKAKEKYQALAEYMIEVLEEYKSEYSDDFWDLEDILNDF